jgi:magnesium chelatase accessory protein
MHAPPPDRVPPDWPNREASRRVDVAPNRWHVQVVGDGPEVLLIHGAGGAGHSWRGLIPLLSKHYRLIVPDLPGQGFSTLGRRLRAGLDPMAEDMTRLLAQEGWRPRAIVAHSAGAAIALRLAEILPRKPAAIVGINPALGPFEGVAGWLFPVMAKLLALNPFVPRLFARFSGGEDKVRSLLGSTGSRLDAEGVRLYARLFADAGHVDGTLMMMSQWSVTDLLRRLQGIDMPTLFITGAGDKAVPPETADRAAARMRDARVVRIPGGHLVHEEDPAAVAGVTLPFLAERVGSEPGESGGADSQG